jgi:hypothetical protein
MAVVLMPFTKAQFFDNAGNPLSGGKLFTFAAGTSTPIASFTDSTGATPNANPVILDSAGRADIWLTSGTAYKFVLQNSAGTQLWSEDNINPAAIANLGATVVTGDLTLQQPTAATAGANQSSNIEHIQGQYWDGTANQTDDWKLQNVLGTGANPSSTLTITHAGSSGAAQLSIPGNVSVGGTLGVTGKATMSNINNMLEVDGVTNTTCQAAVTAAGSNNRIIVVPPTYAGADCPSTITSNIVYWNFDSTRLYLNNGFNWFQKTGANTESFMHPMMQRSAIGAGGALVTGYFTTTLTNSTIGTGIGVDGIASEANTTGTMSGTLPVLQAHEASVLVGSTGGTITTANGVQGYYNSLGGSTTAITTARGVHALGCNVVSGSAPTNCYGIEAADQTSGGVGKASTRNYSIFSAGISLFGFSGGLAKGGFDMEDSAHATHSVLYVDNTNLLNFQAPQTQGIVFRDSSATARMNLTSAGVRIGDAAGASFGFDVGVNAALQGARNFLTEQGAAGAGLAGFTTFNAVAGDHFLHYNPNAQGDQKWPQVLTLTAQYTNSTTGFTTVGTPNISFPVLANTQYTATCHLYYQAAATGGLNIQFTGPAAPTAVVYGLNAPLSVSTFNTSVATAFSTSMGAVVSTAASNFDAVVSFSLINGANAGTVTLQAKSSAAVQLQIQAGSYCIVQ